VVGEVKNRLTVGDSQRSTHSVASVSSPVTEAS